MTDPFTVHPIFRRPPTTDTSTGGTFSSGAMIAPPTTDTTTGPTFSSGAMVAAAQPQVTTNPLVPPAYQDILESHLADSDAFGALSRLGIGGADSAIAQQLGEIYLSGGKVDPAIYQALQLALKDVLGASTTPISDTALAGASADIYATYGEGLRDFVSSVYATTQQYFADQGLDTVTGYHGIDYATPPDGLTLDMAARSAQVTPNGTSIYGQDPTAVIAASQASQNSLDPANYHVIFSQQIAVGDIFSATGDGTFHVLPQTEPQDTLYLGWDGSGGYQPDPAQVEGLLEPILAEGGANTPAEPPTPPESPPGASEGQPAPPGDIYQQTWDYRQQILDAIEGAQAALAQRLGPAAEAIQAELMQFASKIFHAQLNGEDVDPTWLLREGQLQRMLVDIEDALQEFADSANGTLQQTTQNAASLGVAAGTAQLDAAIPPQLAQNGITTQWGRPSEDALRNMVGSQQDPNSPLNMAFAAFGQAAIDLIKQGLFNGLALGQNPHTTAQDLAGQVEDMSLSRANQIARNEMLRAYRTANLMTYQANDDVVDGWIWLAALGTNTCAFCWAENGGYHGNDETLDSHVSCFPTGVLVTGPKAIGSTTRWYEGDLVDIRTANGRFLSVTPNHPILTSKGWIAAGALRKGDDVVCGDGLEGARPIEDIARTVGAATHMRETSPASFHGDGTPGTLTIIREAPHDDSCSDYTSHETFARWLVHAFLHVKMEEYGRVTSPQMPPVDRTTDRHRDPADISQSSPQARRAPPDSAPSSDGPSQADTRGVDDTIRAPSASPAQDEHSFLRVRAARSRDGGLLANYADVPSSSLDASLHPARYSNFHTSEGPDISGAAHVDSASIYQFPYENNTTAIGIDASGYDLRLSKVEKVSRHAFAGYVYNLETERGWYFAGGILVHNCACTMVPVTGDWGSMLSDLEDLGIDESDLEEMGLDFSDFEDTSAVVPRGSDVFAELPPADQQKILGPSKYALYQNGDLQLEDIIAHEQDPQWGGIGYEKSLKDLGFTRDDVIAAQEELARREAEGTLPGQGEKALPEPEPTLTPNQRVEEIAARVRAAEEEAKAAMQAAEQSKGILEKIRTWLQAQMKLRESDARIRDEIAAIDARLLQKRLKVQENERGVNRLTPEVEAATRRLLEERLRQQMVERGQSPLTQEVEDIKARQLEQRLQERREGRTPFAAKREEQPAAPVKTYELTPEDKAFAASIREQIGEDGVLDHQQAIEIGRQIQERIAEQTSESAGWAQEALDIRTTAPDLTEAQRAWAMGDKAAMTEHGGVSWVDAESAYQADYRAKTAAYLQEIRGDSGGLGGELTFDMRGEKADEFVRSQLSEAAKLLPSDWIKASNSLGEIAPIRNRATNSGGWQQDDISGRAEIALSYNKQSDPLAVQTVGLHELMHRMETAVPQLGRMEQDFYRERTAGEEYTKLTNGIGLKTKLDNWLDQYLGAEPLIHLRPPYHDAQLGIEARTVAHYELLTNGTDMALGHAPQAAKFSADREFERFVLGSLAGVKARPEIVETQAMREEPSRAPRNPAPFHQVEEQGQRSFAAKKTSEGVEYSDQAENRDAIKSVFGRSLTPTDLRGVVGAPEGSRVEVTSRGEGKDTVVELKLTGPQNEYEATRYVSLADDGSLVVRNLNISVKERGQGLGSKIFADQVKTLTRLGVKEIITSAEGSGGMGEPGFVPHENGYYTWARLGYQGDIPEGSLQMLHEAASKGEVPKAWAKFSTVQELMATPEGRAWWKEYGSTFEGKFDLMPGSQSHQILDAYLKEKGASPEVKPFSRGALITKWNTEVRRYLTNTRPTAQELSTIAGHLERELNAGRGPGTPTYDDLETQFKDTLKRYKAETKTEGKPPTVTASEVTVKPVKPPRVRTLTAEQQAKRDAADAIRAAKAATTIEKRGEGLEVIKGDMTARVEPDPNLGGYRLTIEGEKAIAGETPQTRAERRLLQKIDPRAVDPANGVKVGIEERDIYRVSIDGQDFFVKRLRDVTSYDPKLNISVTDEVAQRLGLGDIVAPTRIISNKAGDFAVSPWLEGQDLGALPEKQARAAIEALPEKQVQRLSMFEYLMGDEDRGLGGYMRMPDGSIRAIDFEGALSSDMKGLAANNIAGIRYGPEEMMGRSLDPTVISEALKNVSLMRDVMKARGVSKAIMSEFEMRVEKLQQVADMDRPAYYDLLEEQYKRYYPEPKRQAPTVSSTGATTIEGASLARVNALLKERLGYPGVLKADTLEPGPPRTAAEKKAYRETGVKNATKVSKGENALTFTRPDGQAVRVERDMVNGGYKVTVNGETHEGLTLPKANALLKPVLGYNAPLAKEALAPGPKVKPAVQKAQGALTKAQQQLDTIRQAWEAKNPPSLDQRGRPVYRFITPEIFDAQITVAKAQAKLDALQGGRGAAVVVRQTIEPFATEPLAQAMDGLFGRPISNEELAGLVGAPKGSLVILKPDGQGKSASLSIELHGPSWTPNNYHAQAEYTADRLLTWSDNGKYLVMNNVNFGVEARGQGQGIQIFADEVNALAALGVRQIVTNAAGTGSFGEPNYEASANGYYTWPRFGYTGHIPETSMEYLQEAVAAGTVPAKWGKYTTIQQLMATPEGRAWWKTYGSEIDGLVFDLREGSLSRRVLNAYLRERGITIG